MPWLLGCALAAFSTGKEGEGWGIPGSATFGLSADPKANRRRIFPEGLVLPEVLHKGHGMSDIFHLLALILP